MKPAKVKKPKRDRPNLPSSMDAMANTEDLFADRELVSLEEKRICDLERSHLKIETLRLEACELERVKLAQGEFRSLIWKDVRLVGCDLANLRAHRLEFVRVELVDCRLTGLRTSAVEWQDVLVQNGDMRYAQLQSGKFRTCEFEACNLQEADLQGAELSGAIFRSCQLSRADFRRAKLYETDFRSSEVEGMLAGMNDLKDAIVDAGQAMVFARLMGLQIL